MFFNGKNSCAQCSRRVNLWYPDPIPSPASPTHKFGLNATPEFTGDRYKQAFNRALLYVIRGLIVSLIFGFSNAYALDSTLHGLNWLQGQVLTDGSIATEANSVATPFQVRTETAYALRDLAVAPSSLIDAIQAESENNNEYASRRLLVSTSTVSAPDVLNELTIRQNPDGGFGGMPLYQSNPLDTAYALMAAKTLAGKGYNVSQIVSQGLAYLASVQATEGSWALDSQGSSRIYALPFGFLIRPAMNCIPRNIRSCSWHPGCRKPFPQAMHTGTPHREPIMLNKPCWIRMAGYLISMSSTM